MGERMGLLFPSSSLLLLTSLPGVEPTYIGTCTWQATIQNVHKPSTKGERESGDYSTTLLDLR